MQVGSLERIRFAILLLLVFEVIYYIYIYDYCFIVSNVVQYIRHSIAELFKGFFKEGSLYRASSHVAVAFKVQGKGRGQRPESPE